MMNSRNLISSAFRNNENIFITSDIHGFHKNLASGSSSWNPKDGCRDFANEIEMTNTVVDNINSVVGVDDILIHCGDWSFAGKDNIFSLRESINCKTIINIYGNHDENIRKDFNAQDLFFECLDYLEFSISGIPIVCSHYPITEWNEMNRGAIHFFGHRHTKSQVLINGRSMDIGLDSNNLMPYSLRERFDVMTRVPIQRLHTHR